MAEIKLPVPGDHPSITNPDPVPTTPPTPTTPPVPPVPTTPSTPSENEKITIDDVVYKLDKDGNALGENGAIFKTKAEIDAYTNPNNFGEAEIDGKVYKLDKDGNAVNDDGSVFMDKTKIDELSQQSNGEGGINDIIKAVNVIISDDKGNPITYENTVDGIANYINDVVNYNRTNDKKAIEQAFFEANPDIYNVYVHKLNTGSIEGFGNYVDWSKFKIEEMDDAALSNIISANLSRKGNDKSQTDYYVKLIIADGKLKEQAKVAQQELVEADTDAKERAEAIRVANEADQNAATAAYWDNVTNSIKSGKLTINGETYKLPQVYRIKTAEGKTTTANNDDFLNYITKPLTFEIEGNSYQLTQNQYDIIVENSTKTHENEIWEALRRFVKYDDSQFIKEQVRQETARRIIINTAADSKRGGDPNQSTNKTLKLPLK